jgi:DNA-damage-inducible protein D
MSDLELFMKSFSGDNFENYSHENGFTYWYAVDLMNLLGYESMSSFQRAINKAMTTCNTLNIPIIDNFLQEQRIIEGRPIMDFRLSRFACYLTVMNSDGKKPAVAMAQSYFATLAGAVHTFLEEANQVERLVTREEISERERSLSGVVHQSGLESYPFFQNAGYRGMYNKNISQLKMLRSIPANKSLLDFMGKEELAANLFRITQTELKIKQDSIKGQRNLENTAETVGRKVRQSMKDISGVLPEELPTNEDLKDVKKHLKEQSKNIKKLDIGKKKRK